MWAVGLMLDNDFRVGFLSLLLWVPIRRNVYFLGVYRGPALWRPFAGPPGASDPQGLPALGEGPVLWALSS